MIQAFFNGVSGASTNQFGVDTWSNNIANVNTVAYKADVPTFQTVFNTAMDGLNANSPISNTIGYGVTTGANGMDTDVGSFKVTEEDSFNMAISENGWFTVGTMGGDEIYYTRDGSFTRDSEGYLVNSEGFYLYGIDLEKVNNGVFTSDTDANVELNNTSPTFQPMQVQDDIYFQPTETTYVNSQINLNSQQNIKTIDDAFAGIIYDGDIQQIAQRDMGQFYDIKDGYTMSIGLLDTNGNQLYTVNDETYYTEDGINLLDEDGVAATDDDGNQLLVENAAMLKGEFTYRAEPDTSANEFNTIQQLQELINNDENNSQIEFVLSIQDDNFVFKNISGEDYIMDFTGSSLELLQAFSLPEKSQVSANGDSVTTAPLYQKSFYEQDMNTLYNDNDELMGFLTNDDFGVNVNGGSKEKIIYTNSADSDNISDGKFNTVEEFVAGVENLLRDPDTGEKRVQVYMQDCRLIFENISDEAIDIEFSSTNVDLISNLGLSSEIHLDPEGTTQTSLLQVPTYTSSHEVYDIDGDKYYLKTDYVLKSNSELGTSNEVWDSVSMIYALENNALVSSDYTLGQIRFTGSNSEPKLYSVEIDSYTGDKVYTEQVYSSKDGIDEKYLTVDFSGASFAEGTTDKSIKFNPTGIIEEINGQDVWNYSSTEKYMDSLVRERDKNGNPEGYIANVVVDLNGIVNFYFSNDVAEEMGRVGLVDFINVQGLEKVGGNLYRATNNSGDETVMWDGETGLLKETTVMQGKLETSNVDMNVALTELIVMQRAYSANTKSITTADEMLQKAIELKK
jgi:flagellar hook protein FlgE